jgi:hypothetical protein
MIFGTTAEGVGVSGIAPDHQSTQLQLLPTIARPRSSGAGGEAGTGVPLGLPIAVDLALAGLLDLSVGDQVTLSLGSARDLPATIAVISAVLPGPGSDPKVLVDLAGLSAAALTVSSNLPALNQLWIDPIDGPTAAADVRPLVPATSLIELADSRSAQALLTPASRTLWLGAVGATVLAAIGVGTVIAVVSRSRRGERVALRASGITARAQAASRRRELFSVCGAGWLLGLAVGAVAVLATIPGLAGSTIVGSFDGEPPIRWDTATAAWLIGAQIVVVGAVIVGHGLWLRRAVLDATPSELTA